MKNVKILKEHHDFPDLALPSPLNPNIQCDLSLRMVFVKDVLHRVGAHPWQSTNIELALLPPTVFCDHATRLVDNVALFDTYLCGLSMFAGRQTESKSLLAVLKSWSKMFVKTAEFAWINGFYDLREVPESLWEQLHCDILESGWCRALQIEARVAKFVSTVDLSEESYLDDKKVKGKISVKRSILSLLGTNISGRELSAIKSVLLQARTNDQLRSSGDISRYKPYQKLKPSSGTVMSVLNSMEILAQIDPAKAVMRLPGGSRYAISMRNDRASARTKNIDPEKWANLLKHAYRWIFDLSPEIVIFVIALAKSQQRLIASGDAVGMTVVKKSTDRLQCLEELPEAKLIENKLGLRVTSYLKSNSPEGAISVNSLILNLYISCFLVLASMNGRRKDEIIDKSIGLHVESLRKIDDVFATYECEFYMEKSVRDYRAHYINDVSRRAIEIMMKISGVAWWLCDAPEMPTTGRDKKLFLIPNFTVCGFAKWFVFSNCTIRDAWAKFTKNATGEDMHLTPHMLRRGYGVLYHYRYDNAQLVALAQKYGHLDLSQALHYVSDAPDTPHEKTALAKWSSPKNTLDQGEKILNSEMNEIVHEVGVEKIRLYISEVVDSSRTFSGGFSKLVARFHRRLGALVRYNSLDLDEQKKLVTSVVVSRGHNLHPYPWVNCMAGSSRKHSACTTGGGDILRENASPSTCSGCPYSDISLVHLQNLEVDAAALEKQCRDFVGTLREQGLLKQLKDIRRIIELHRSRLGVI